MPRDITLLIATKDRAEFIIRLLRYYRDVGFEGKITIGDSSAPEQTQAIQEEIDAVHKQLAVTCQVFPAELSVGQIIRRQLESVSSPYVVFLGDDDYLVPSGLEACVRFLGRSPTYHAAHGRGALFILKQNGAYGDFRGVGPYPQGKVEAEAASERLSVYLGNYFMVLFSVHRTESFQRMYRDVGLTPNLLFANELLPCCLSVVLGRVKALEDCYLFRQGHQARTFHGDVFDWAATQDSFAPSCKQFLDLVSEELALQDGLAVAQAREIVKQAFWSYMARNLTKGWNRRYGCASLSARGRMRAALGAVPGFRSVWQTLQAWVPTSTVSLPSLLRRSSPHHADFMPIYEAITRLCRL